MIYLSNIYRNITYLATAAEHQEQKMMLAQSYFHNSSIWALPETKNWEGLVILHAWTVIGYCDMCSNSKLYTVNHKKTW